MSQNKTRLDQKQPPFETKELRANLKKFYDKEVTDKISGVKHRLGNYKWGVYAFFDYDNEPIYVGQTYESLRSRIGRHLTNQRTDAVAMSVLDPFEVAEIEVWPLPQYQSLSPKRKTPEVTEAKEYLNTLEYLIFERSLQASMFKAVLNEKDPTPPSVQIEIPSSHRGRIISDKIFALRGHADSRIARRALTISRLAQVISERQVQGGLRRVLSVQAKRLAWLAEQRFNQLGGGATVEIEDPEALDDEIGDS